jgi:hypothetical protein
MCRIPAGALQLPRSSTSVHLVLGPQDEQHQASIRKLLLVLSCAHTFQLSTVGIPLNLWSSHQHTAACALLELLQIGTQHMRYDERRHESRLACRVSIAAVAHPWAPQMRQLLAHGACQVTASMAADHRRLYIPSASCHRLRAAAFSAAALCAFKDDSFQLPYTTPMATAVPRTMGANVLPLP